MLISYPTGTYNHGCAKLQTVWALPESIAPITNISPSHLRVLLPDGTTAPIPMLRNYDASLMLGIYFGPTSSGRTHICEMAQKGFIWANQIKSWPFPPLLAWQSLTHQRQPDDVRSCYCWSVPSQVFGTVFNRFTSNASRSSTSTATWISHGILIQSGIKVCKWQIMPWCPLHRNCPFFNVIGVLLLLIWLPWWWGTHHLLSRWA